MKATEKIRLAAERATCQAVTYLETVPVVETDNGTILWDGMVEVYSLPMPPPERIYGWIEGYGLEQKFVTILGKPPINSPLDAVRAWIASVARK